MNLYMVPNTCSFACKIPIPLDVSWKEVRHMSVQSKRKNSVQLWCVFSFHLGWRSRWWYVSFSKVLQLWFSLTIKRCYSCLTEKILFTHSTLCSERPFPYLKPNIFVMQLWQWEKYSGYFELSWSSYVLDRWCNGMMLAEEIYFFLHGRVPYLF